MPNEQNDIGESHFFICERCGRDPWCSQKDIPFLKNPCFYCSGRLIRREVYQQREVERFLKKQLSLDLEKSESENNKNQNTGV